MKNSLVRISLDAMGGDHGPLVAVRGAYLLKERRPNTEFLIFGDQKQVAPLLDLYPSLKSCSHLYHTDVAIKMTDKPSQALRTGRKVSSMWKSIEAVKEQKADVCISAGNTGALMAMAKFCLHTLPNVDRPAIAALWPTLTGESIVLDLGATIGADAHHLVELAIMGAAMAQILFNIDKPSVGLLNVGVEEIKGLEEIKEAGRILKETNWHNLTYFGFVEGNDLGKGIVDVVVTEGFSGNIALKTAEGTAKQVLTYLKEGLQDSLFSRIGYLFAHRAFKHLKQKVNPGLSTGGVFLGLNGIVIKSHGSADASGYAGAIDIGYDMVHYNLLERIKETIPLSKTSSSTS